MHRAWMRSFLLPLLVLISVSRVGLAEVLVIRQADSAEWHSFQEVGPWKAVGLPHDWDNDGSGSTGNVVYRLRFEPASQWLKGRDPVLLYVQRACTNLEVTVNGELVGRSGSVNEPLSRHCYYPQLFSVPRRLLREGRNELSIQLRGFPAQQVASRQRVGGLSEVRLGTLDELQPMHETQWFWNITMAQVMCSMMFCVGLFMLVLGWMRPQAPHVVYFGAFSLAWGVFSVRLFAQHYPLSNQLSEVLIGGFAAVVQAFFVLFLWGWSGIQTRWLTRALCVQVAFSFAWLSINARDLLSAASQLYSLLAVELLVAWITFFFVMWRRQRSEFWFAASFFVFTVLLLGYEIGVQQDWLPMPDSHLILVAYPAFMLVVAARLIQRFVYALDEAEALNLHLEQRVAEKSHEIQRSYERIAALLAEQAAQQERQRIAADLHDDLGAKLLTLAQVSTTPRTADLARQALEDMRMSVRGLTSRPVAAGHVFADWRAEAVSRLTDAGLQAKWSADGPALNALMPARMYLQLTRVVREALSNVIRHSGAQTCWVCIRCLPNKLVMHVQDDGLGLPTDAYLSGHGLLGMERRVRQLGGRSRMTRPAGGGMRWSMFVPWVAEES